MINNLIRERLLASNRIVVTHGHGFNSKRKKDNLVLADIREIDSIESFRSSFEVDINSKVDPGWMTAPEIYINLLENKNLLLVFGLLINSWVRSNDWDGDYSLKNPKWFHHWLVENGVRHFEQNS